MEALSLTQSIKTQNILNRHNSHFVDDANVEYYIGYTDFVRNLPIRGMAGGPNPIPVFGTPPKTGKKTLIVSH